MRIKLSIERDVLQAVLQSAISKQEAFPPGLLTQLVLSELYKKVYLKITFGEKIITVSLCCYEAVALTQALSMSKNEYVGAINVQIQKLLHQKGIYVPI